MTQQVDLGFRPREWQRACFIGLQRKRFGVLVVHRRGGKTVMAVMRTIDAALKCKRENGRYAYIAPLRHQAKTIEKFCRSAAVLRHGQLYMFDTLEEAKRLYDYETQG